MQTQVLYYASQNPASNQLLSILRNKYPNALHPQTGLRFACVDNPFQENGKNYIMLQNGTKMAIPNLQYIPAMFCLRDKILRYGDDIVKHVHSIYNEQSSFVGAMTPRAGAGAGGGAPPTQMVTSQRGTQHPYQQQQQQPSMFQPAQPVQPAGMGHGQPAQPYPYATQGQGQGQGQAVAGGGGGGGGSFLDAASDVWSVFTGAGGSSGGGGLMYDFLEGNENTLYTAFETITGIGMPQQQQQPHQQPQYSMPVQQENGYPSRGHGAAAQHTQMMAQRERDVPRHAYQTR